MNITHQEILRLLRAQKSIPEDSSLWPPEWSTIMYKEYELSEKVSVEKNLLSSLETSHHKIVSLIASRVSGYYFNKPLTVEEIFFILSCASREKNKESKRRMYPSGGALYPLELYFVQQGKGVLPRGVYHFSQVNDILVRIKKFSEKNEDIFNEDIFTEGNTYNGMTSFIVITYTPKRNTSKYNFLGVKLGLIEAGILLQNISLLATSCDVQTRAIAGFSEAKVQTLLELSKHEEFPLLLIAVSK